MFRVLTAVFAVLALSGCAGTTSTDSETKAAAPDAAAATGEKISGTGYTYNVPDGWGPPKELPPQVEADSLAIDLTDGDNSQASVNVIRVPGSDAGTLDDAESGAKKNMDVGGSTDVSINDRVSVDGAESVHVTSTQEMGNQKNITEQFLMLHGENAYGVTFAFHTKVPAKERADVTGAVLASWTWTD